MANTGSTGGVNRPRVGGLQRTKAQKKDLDKNAKVDAPKDFSGRKVSQNKGEKLKHVPQKSSGSADVNYEQAIRKEIRAAFLGGAGNRISDYPGGREALEKAVDRVMEETGTKALLGRGAHVPKEDIEAIKENIVNKTQGTDNARGKDPQVAGGAQTGEVMWALETDLGDFMMVEQESTSSREESNVNRERPWLNASDSEIAELHPDERFLVGRMKGRKKVTENMKANLDAHHQGVHDALEGNPFREVFFDNPDYALILNEDPKKLTQEKILKKFSKAESQYREAERKIDQWMIGTDPSHQKSFKESEVYKNFLRNINFDEGNIDVVSLRKAMLGHMKLQGATAEDMLRMLCRASNIQSNDSNLDRFIEREGKKLLSKGIDAVDARDIQDAFNSWRGGLFEKRRIAAQNKSMVKKFFEEHSELGDFKKYFDQKVKEGRVDLNSPDFSLEREVIIAANFFTVARKTNFLGNVTKKLSDMNKARGGEQAEEFKAMELIGGDDVDQCKGMMTQFKGLGVELEGKGIDSLIEGQRVIEQADIDSFNSDRLATAFTSAKAASAMGDKGLVEKFKQSQD